MRKILFAVLCLHFVSCLVSFKFHQVRGNCEINGTGLENRTIFYRPSGNGAMQLLLKSSVPIGTRLILACEDSKLDEPVTCTKSTPLIGMKMEPCKRPLKAIVRVADPNAQMPDCTSPNIDYKIGYDYGNNFYELYRVCFNKAEKRTLFTRNEFEGFSDKYKSPRPDDAFTTDFIYTTKENEKLSPESVNKTFESLLSTTTTTTVGPPPSKKPKLEYPCIIARGHLTSQNDFFQYSNKKATFKLINMVPEFQKINSKNWVKIENWSHNAYSGQNTIITGAFEVLKLKNDQNIATEMYLQAPNQMPIPTWMYKIVASKGKCTIFLTYNNIYNNALNTKCKSKCPSNLKLDSSKEAGHTVCCTKKEFESFAKIYHNIKC